MNIDFSQAKILVVGDLMLDEYIVGRDYRMSDEAPVPILKVDEFKVYLGGAANVAHNIHALGGTPIICGVVGGGVAKDKHGHSFFRFMELINKLGLDQRGIVSSEGLTTTKSRLVINGQQVARYDYEQHTLDPHVHAEVLSRVNDIDSNEIDLIVVSDYRKGVVTSELMDLLRLKNIPIVVDPKPGNELLYNRVGYITPNLKEFMVMIKETDSEHVAARLREKSQEFAEQYDLRALIITMGESGVYYYQDSANHGFIEAERKEVSNQIGAGDTFVSAFSLCLCAGNLLKESLSFAIYAAGVVVSKEFTGVCLIEDVKEKFQNTA